MVRTITKGLLIVVFVAASCRVYGSEPNDYLEPGREYLFDGTLSGLRTAYEIFSDGLDDPLCTNCSQNRELKFFHALAGTVMLFVRDDGNNINSGLELAEAFAIDVIGDYWGPYYKPLMAQLIERRNRHDLYEIPEDAPDRQQFKEIIDSALVPEINNLIEDLNSIDDSPTDRFRLYLEPNELRIFFLSDSSAFDPYDPGYDPNFRFLSPVEVDYAEVLQLKGILYAVKAGLQGQDAYDLYVDDNDLLFERLYGDAFEVNRDLLNKYPDLLKVLPTANDSNNGAAVLAAARQDLVDAVNYYLDAIDYINAEDNPTGSDPQENELLYIEPKNKHMSETVRKRLITLRDSLLDDIAAEIPMETTKTYVLQESSNTWQLALIFDLVGMGVGGSFVLTEGSGVPSPWEVYWFGIEANELTVEMDYDVPGYWGGGYLEATISPDHNSITDGTFNYWGPSSGTLYGLAGDIDTISEDIGRININPMLGDSSSYPEPVNPRDLLPEFDQWNSPLAGTFGHGLGDDATLGGVWPDMSQWDWQTAFELQPGEVFNLDFVLPGDIVVDGNVSDWDMDQLVYIDISGDTDKDEDPNPNDVNGVDIKDVYLAYDFSNLYGAISFYDGMGTTWQNYDIRLGYVPQNDSEFGAMRFHISIYYDSISGTLYRINDQNGFTYWDDIGSFNADYGADAIEFSVPLSNLPGELAGRFISIATDGSDSAWTSWGEDEDNTNMRIGGLGSISGNVSYDGYCGDPIFVQAYTNPYQPDHSIVATTMITEPGPYTLDGIGMDWRGYVRAFTPSLSLENPFAQNAFKISESESVYLMFSPLSGLDFELTYPQVLEDDVWVVGELEADVADIDWYYFDAVAGGTYTIDLNRGTAANARLSLYEPDGQDDLIELQYWQTQQMVWYCETSGRYYVQVSYGYDADEYGTYQVKMSTDVNCSEADIAGSEGPGFKDCEVDIYDLSAMMSRWLDGCSYPWWCDGADVDQSDDVDFKDFAELAESWLTKGVL